MGNPEKPPDFKSVRSVTKRMGIDWVVKTVADELGVDCACPERQRKLNELDAKFRRFLGW